MQGILYLTVFAACFELSTARSKLKTVGVMASLWPRPGHHQAGGSSATLHHKADHPYHSDPLPPPCSPVLRCPKGMNPQLEASASTEARGFFARDIKGPAGEKSRAVRASWSIISQASQDSHQKVQRRLPIMSGQDSQRLLNMPKNRNMLRLRSSTRAKRSVALGTTVQYTDFKDVKFRKQGVHSHYLTPAASGNSLTLSTQHLNHSCFRAHIFVDVTANLEGGFLVMLQAHTGSYLHASSSGFLSLMDSEAGAATVTQVDNRFFRIYSYVGDSVVRIKHIVTDLHLQATVNGVSLVSTDPLADEGMHFYKFNCSTT